MQVCCFKELMCQFTVSMNQYNSFFFQYASLLLFFHFHFNGRGLNKRVWLSYMSPLFKYLPMP